MSLTGSIACAYCDNYNTTCRKCFDYHMLSGGANYPNAPKDHKQWACTDVVECVPCDIHKTVYTCECCKDYSTTCEKCFRDHMQSGGSRHPNAPAFHRTWAHDSSSEPCKDHVKNNTLILSELEPVMRKLYNEGFPDATFEYSQSEGWKMVDKGDNSGCVGCMCSWRDGEIYKTCYSCRHIESKIQMLMDGYPNAQFAPVGMFCPAWELVTKGDRFLV